MAENLDKKLGEANQDAVEFGASLISIGNALNDILKDTGNLAKNFGIVNEQSKKAKSLADELATLSKKQLTDRKEVNKIQSKANELTRQLKKDQIDLNRLTQLKQNTTGAESRLLKKIIEQKIEELSVSQGILNTTNDILSVAKELNDKTKYWDRAADFLTKIPVIGPTLAKPFRDISTALKNAKDDSNLLLVGLNAAANSITALSLGFFLTQAFKASAQVADLQKSLLLSKNEAYALREEFIGVAAASGDAAITTNRLLEANAALSKQLGFSKRFSDDLNIGFSKLTKQMGLSEEAAGGLAKASIITGRSMKSITNDAAGAVSSLSAQYGIQLNVRDVLERAGKSSSVLLANFKGNPVELAKAVAEMDALGTSLETTQKQANALLNFQSSIQEQLNASLITGRNIQLDKARELALNNDLVGLAKELNNQSINYGEFSKMNAIQRSSIAKSLGLETQELSDQLLKLETQGKSRTQIVALMGEEAANRAMSLSAQEKFNNAVEKISGLFGNLMDGPLGKVVDMMAAMAESAGVVSTAIGVLAAVQLGSLLTSLSRAVISMGSLAISSITAGSALTLGIGAIAITAGIVAAVAAYNSAKSSNADDLMSGYGDRTLITPNGSYA
jgi:hypothetical protein